MTSPVGKFGGYRKMYSFGFTCLTYHATVRFCKQVYPWKEDPLGKTSGQMIGAARSARQNIVEGSSRAGTSTETELKLLDVAKASLEELAGDYEAYLIDNEEEVWSEHDPRHQEIATMDLDAFDGGEDAAHRYSKYMLAMNARFAPWLKNEDPIIAANAILIVLRRAERLLGGQIGKVVESFGETGGFKERLHAFRMQAKEQEKANELPPPECPACGKQMRLRKAKTGPNAGKPFWGCTGYPVCKAITEAE
jgi:four helix bundle suffix protein